MSFNWLLFVYEHSVDFSLRVLCLATLLNSVTEFMNSSLGFSNCTILSSTDTVLFFSPSSASVLICFNVYVAGEPCEVVVEIGNMLAFFLPSVGMPPGFPS